MSSRIVVIGAGLGGLATSALLARAGHEVTLIEGQDWVGGKSRRIEVAGQRIDTGPSLVTFPEVLEQVLNTYDEVGPPGEGARDIAGITLERLPEVGRYYFKDQQANLPVEPEHPWHDYWARFEQENGHLGPAITHLLTTDPTNLGILGAVVRLLSRYGSHLTTQSYLDSLTWMPQDVKDVVAIHTLNAGVAPDQTLALFASMAAVMASDGVFVPRGGVYEIARGLEALALHAGVTIRTSEPVVSVRKGLVTTSRDTYTADYVVSALDGGILEGLLGKKAPAPEKLSCSGVAIFGVLDEELPKDIVTHSVMMPDEPAALFDDLGKRVVPSQTMAFLNYYRANTIYPNDKPVAALLLTAPPNGMSATIEDDFVQSESRRFSNMLGLERGIIERMTDYRILHPEYFASFGAVGGALYGAPAPWWRSGPFHTPPYNSPLTPWLWRVGS
ncbi:MAG: NAD(P)/FAD-dependent oxidoreductase, partial [Pontimonas sp.]